jgi:hypothetical protein
MFVACILGDPEAVYSWVPHDVAIAEIETEQVHVRRGI